MTPLADVIRREADLASAFVIVLEEEQQVLKDGHPDSLPALVERKAELIAGLNPLSAERNRILTAARLPADRQGMEAWFRNHPGDTATRSEWKRLLDLTQHAHELNRVNGELIRLRQQHTTATLEALLPNQSRDLYSPEGQPSSLAARRIIDSA